MQHLYVRDVLQLVYAEMKYLFNKANICCTVQWTRRGQWAGNNRADAQAKAAVGRTQQTPPNGYLATAHGAIKTEIKRQVRLQRNTAYEREAATGEHLLSRYFFSWHLTSDPSFRPKEDHRMLTRNQLKIINMLRCGHSPLNFSKHVSLHRRYYSGEWKRCGHEISQLVAMRREQKAKRKEQVLRLDSADSFDEEWFVVTEAQKTEGPLTRWQLMKQAQQGRVHADTVTFLNGCTDFRFLKMCGELQGLLPFIDRNATVQPRAQDEEAAVCLTKGQLEAKRWYFKDAYQTECGPISLSEVFYKLEDGILGRNSQIRQEAQVCWKTVEFVQHKFSKEWQQMTRLKQGQDGTATPDEPAKEVAAEEEEDDVQSDVEMHLAAS